MMAIEYSISLDTSSSPASSTATLIRADGRTIEEMIPDGDGLRLLRSAHNAKIALRSGVTTMCDFGAWNDTAFP